MKLLSIAVTLLFTTSVVTSLSLPLSEDALDRRISELDARAIERHNDVIYSYLEKRRGGGGKGGGSSSGSSGGSSSGSKGGSTGGTSGGTTSTSSRAGPSYGGGRYYGGGATSAYSAGRRSPLGITPFLLGGAALAFFPGLWLYGAYAYPYSHSYPYHNATSNGNETLPVTCLCQEYSACGCDDNGNATYVDSLLGNGSAADMNSTLARVADVNGTKTLVINGTLPNGTDNSTTTGSTSAGFKQVGLESSGFWVMGVIVGLTVWAM